MRPRAIAIDRDRCHELAHQGCCHTAAHGDRRPGHRRREEVVCEAQLRHVHGAHLRNIDDNGVCRDAGRGLQRATPPCSRPSHLALTNGIHAQVGRRMPVGEHCGQRCRHHGSPNHRRRQATVSQHNTGGEALKCRIHRHTETQQLRVPHIVGSICDCRATLQWRQGGRNVDGIMTTSDRCTHIPT